MTNTVPQKIVIVGNSSCGKTTLSRRLAEVHKLPLYHVDSIQFVKGMKIRPHHESIAMLTEIQKQNSWIIEGYGPLDIIETRFDSADKIIFIDFPIWKHYFWSLKRQLKLFLTRSQRSELPEDCFEGTFSQTVKLLKNIRNVHYKMRPELLKFWNREKWKHKVIVIRSQKEWNQIYSKGIKPSH